jgi:hypothetical protein
VTKDALLTAVWPDTVVSENVITVAMRQLRRVLGDQTRTPHFIETVHGRGYRFIAPVSATTSPARPAMIEASPCPLSSTVSRPLLFSAWFSGDCIAFISYKRSIAQHRSWQRSFSVWLSTTSRLPCFWRRTPRWELSFGCKGT